MCPYCYTIIYQGCRHKCGALSRAKNLLNQTSDLEKERIADNILKKKLDGEKSQEGTIIQLRTFGRPRTHTITKGKIRKRRRITYELVKKAKTSANMSNRQTTKFLAHMRHGIGRGWIVSHMKKLLTESNKIFDEDFVSESIEMEVNKNELKTGKEKSKELKTSKKNTTVMQPIPAVYVKNLDMFVRKVLKERGNVNLNSMFIKIGVDDGRGKLKISLSLVPKFTSEGDPDGANKKFLEPFKLTGVKRLMLIACATAKETSTNLQILFDKTGLLQWDVDYKIVADLCAINKLIGIGNHKSSYPCYICTWRSSDNSGYTKGASKRTFRTIKGIWFYGVQKI